MPTDNSELWAVIKNLPITFQIIIIFLILSNFISVPANVDAILNVGPTIDGIKLQIDSTVDRMERLERSEEKRDERIDSIAAIHIRQEDMVGFLWCVNERGETPEVRQLCADIREAAKQAQQVRALERR